MKSWNFRQRSKERALRDVRTPAPPPACGCAVGLNEFVCAIDGLGDAPME